jgi:hypothetical protein
MVKRRTCQRLSSAPAPPQDDAWRLRVSRHQGRNTGPLGEQSGCLGCQSEPRPRSPIPPPAAPLIPPPFAPVQAWASRCCPSSRSSRGATARSSPSAAAPRRSRSCRHTHTHTHTHTHMYAIIYISYTHIMPASSTPYPRLVGRGARPPRAVMASPPCHGLTPVLDSAR